MSDTINCILCHGNKARVIYRNYPGYIEGTKFDIYSCPECNTNFISQDSIDKRVYELIYSDSATQGYDRYYNYALQVKGNETPLKLLAESESTYFPVYDYVKNKKNIRTLEIGSGYGYLTYGLRKMGFDSTGIDISSNAVKFASENFGDYYVNCDLKSFGEKTKAKYDLIVATEVIEHLTDYMGFIDDALKLLKDDGRIIFTTPNKNFRKKDAIWQTDLPPVHTIWFSRESLLYIAKQKNLNIALTDFSKYYPGHENKLVKFIRAQKEFIPSPILDVSGRIRNASKVQFSLMHRTIWNILHKFAPVRFISNLLYNIFSKNDVCIGVILWKK